jgi:hypothetical protein
MSHYTPGYIFLCHVGVREYNGCKFKGIFICGRRCPVKPTCGCGSSGTDGEGPQGLMGLLISVAFVYMFVFIFLPESAQEWFLPSFIAAEIGAAVLYLVADRRSRTDADRLRRELHKINEKTDR